MLSENKPTKPQGSDAKTSQYNKNNQKKKKEEKKEQVEMNWYLVAGITPIILGVYQLTIDWLNLYPFNHPSAKTLKERTLEPLLNYAPLVLVALGYLGGSRQGVGLALGGSVLYLLGHLNAWWRPYFLGASLKEQAEYERLFKHTFKVLPPIKEHPIPDLQHMLLGLLVGLMVSAGLLAFLSLS